GSLSPTQWEDKPAFLMARPESLYRLQRREYFRIEVPAKNPATFTVLDPPMGDANPVFPVYDISAGGLRLIDRDRLLGETIGKIYDGRLDMPDLQSLEIGLRVLHQRDALRERQRGANRGVQVFQPHHEQADRHPAIHRPARASHDGAP